ncbi:hypothetical protein PCASD_01795 [Puccinia coronata f. sp. avenae]|uniref:Uncharacterized protein n=1 Tax=Puccinia coronata f. sp. avenae TaxID=200324 RepID=A0A2N5VJG8_9BASI|nr:hypothetical protein PCASD_01795 [Puccinia coronata f. sp. avenae]
MDLLAAPEPQGPTHEEKIDAIYRRYPKVKKWLDWWTTANVEAMLFQSHKPLIEDTPDGLPETTNAQESMHRLYYMISPGHTSLMVGMIELFSFVTVLEEDWNSVMKGVPICYGTGQKSKDVGVSMGLSEKRKRNYQAPNDGRPPNTTDALLERVPKKAKLGRPQNAANFDKNPYLTYVSYHAITKNPSRANCCWLAAFLESLYSLFSPLWLRGINGNGKDLFSYAVQHFMSRSTFKLTQKGTIKSILTRGQNKIFDLASEKYVGRFNPGKCASCDYFLEVLLDPSQHRSDMPSCLFQVNKTQEYTCQAKPDVKQSHPTRESPTPAHVLSVTPQMFNDNRITYSDVGKLIDLWQTTGLQVLTGLVCKQCLPQGPEAPSKPVKKKEKLKRINSNIAVVTDAPLQTPLYIIFTRLADWYSRTPLPFTYTSTSKT